MLDATAALSALDHSVVALVAERDQLVVAGADAASYLQGQVSQDVEALAVGATSRTLLLQPQGKVEAWLRIHRRADAEFWLDTDPGHGELAAARLERFKLRVAATIETRTITVLALRGPDAAATSRQADDGVVVLDAGWGGIDGCDLFTPGADDHTGAVALAGQLGLDPAPEPVAEVVRVLQGLPAMGRELDDSTIPAAAGVVDQSVSFTKGCYVGQELVARIDSRGNNTPTRLHALRFDGPEAPDAGAELLVDGEVVGRVTSAVAVPGSDAAGLGYLKRTVDPSTPLVTGPPRGQRVTARQL